MVEYQIYYLEMQMQFCCATTCQRDPLIDFLKNICYNIYRKSK